MTRANYRFECLYCHLPEAICDRDYDDPVCTECNSSLDKILLCECGRDAAMGCTDCNECLADLVIADPKEFDGLAREIQVEVAKVLAGRLKPWLRVPQAA
jgi:hypothetical protein